MKKMYALMVCVTAWGTTLFAQSGGAEVGLLNVGNYSKLFLNGNGRMHPKYIRAVSDDGDDRKIADLSGDKEVIDTPLEIALLSTCTGVVDVRPVEAVKMLGTAREADLKLGAAVYMDMQAAKFLGSDPAPYAAALKFITDRGRVTEANIRDFVKQGIAAAVDAEFNKVSRFMIDRKYNAVLAYDPQTGQYTLSYERPSVENDDKKLSASTPEALLSAMSRSGDFSTAASSVVREQAALIPAVVLAETGTVDVVLGTVKKALVDFYLSPTTANYNTVKDIQVLFIHRAREYSQDPLFEMISFSYLRTLNGLSIPLANKVSSESLLKEYATSSTLTQTQINDLTVRR